MQAWRRVKRIKHGMARSGRNSDVSPTGRMRNAVRDLAPAIAAAVAEAVRSRSRSRSPMQIDRSSQVVERVQGGSARATATRDHSGVTKSLVKRKRKRSKKKVGLKDLKKSVKTIQKKLKGAEGTLIYPVIGSGVAESLANKINFELTNVVTYSDLETVIQQIPYVNPADPSSTTSFNALTIPPPTGWNIKLSYSCNIRNNNFMPCNLRIYLLKPRSNTGVSPIVAIETLNKQDPAGLPTPTRYDIGLYPTEVPGFNEIWSIEDTRMVRLNPGDETEYKFNKQFMYDQEIHDLHAVTYLKDYTYVLLFRLQGITCHESADLSEVGISPTKLDYVTQKKLHLTYSADAPMKFRSYTNNCPAITTAATTGEEIAQETQS